MSVVTDTVRWPLLTYHHLVPKVPVGVMAPLFRRRLLVAPSSMQWFLSVVHPHQSPGGLVLLSDSGGLSGPGEIPVWTREVSRWVRPGHFPEQASSLL